MCETAWNTFAATADIEGGDLAELLRRVMRGTVGNGEAFVRMITGGDGRLCLQLLNPEQVAPWLHQELPDGGRIIAGVEVGPDGEVRAYHILPQNPDAWLATVFLAPVRVDAADVLHIFDPRHAGQVRGLSWLTPVATRILQLDQLEDAMLARAKVAALFAGFISDPDGTSGFGEGTRDPQEMSLEPGVLRVLPPSATVNFPAMPDSGETPAFLKHLLRSIAAGVGLPYEILASDLSDTNYSSAKLGMETFRNRCKALRASMLTTRLLLPVWRRLIATEIVAGRLRAPGFVSAPDDYFAASFLWPAPASIDPLKDAESDQILLANAIKSRAQIIAERGRDIADVEAEISADPRPLPQPRPIAPANPVRA
jgi:lambda family phage portal protein